jgi:hypothetical protein
MVHDYLRKSIEKQTGRASAALVMTLMGGVLVFTRPLSERCAERVPRAELVRLAGLFEPHAEVIDEYAQPLRDDGAGSGTDRILGTLCRRPWPLYDRGHYGGTRPSPK